jgi:hypothetical protein
MRSTSYLPGELILLPSSGSIPELPNVAERIEWTSVRIAEYGEVELRIRRRNITICGNHGHSHSNVVDKVRIKRSAIRWIKLIIVATVVRNSNMGGIEDMDAAATSRLIGVVLCIPTIGKVGSKDDAIAVGVNGIARRRAVHQRIVVDDVVLDNEMEEGAADATSWAALCIVTDVSPGACRYSHQ